MKESFSRLAALTQLGVVSDFSAIRRKAVVVVGIGGVGSVAAEMLARCGVKKLVLFDYDTVELANMNRMFFTPDQVGISKVEAASATLRHVTQGTVEVAGFNCNVCTVEGYQLLRSEILSCRTTEGVDETLMLCCVDNYAARISVNRVCLELDQVWLESGVSETAMSGHVQVMRPGLTACFECAPPCVIAEAGDESKIIRAGVCAASLPTTMSIVAGLLVQTALKLLLQFGTVQEFTGYDGLTDFMPVYQIKPNPECGSHACKSLQRSLKPPDLPVTPESVQEETRAIHDSNEWGIEVEDSGSVSHSGGTQPVKVSDRSMSDLMAQLRRK